MARVSQGDVNVCKEKLKDPYAYTATAREDILRVSWDRQTLIAYRTIKV